MKIGIHAPKQGATGVFHGIAQGGNAEMIVWLISEQPTDALPYPNAFHVLRVPTPSPHESAAVWIGRVEPVCRLWANSGCFASGALAFQLGNEPEIQAWPDVPTPWNLDEWKAQFAVYRNAFEDRFPGMGILVAPFSARNTGLMTLEYCSQGHGIACHAYWSEGNPGWRQGTDGGASWFNFDGFGMPVYVTEVNSNPCSVDELKAWVKEADAGVVAGCAFYIADCPPSDVDAPYNVTLDTFKAVHDAYEKHAPSPVPAPPPPAPQSGYTADSSLLGGASWHPERWIAAISKHNPEDAKAVVDAWQANCAVAGIDANAALAQVMDETEWLTSPAWRQRHNPAGIGITSDAVLGKDFGTVDRASKAHIALLCCYAMAETPKAVRNWGVLESFGYGGFQANQPAIRYLEGHWDTAPGYADTIAAICNEVAGVVPPAPSPEPAPTPIPAHLRFGIVLPVDDPVLEDSWGTFSHAGRSPGFYAVDFGSPRGTPVRAAADGLVRWTYWTDSNPISLRTGHSIYIAHDNGYSTFSCHLSRFDVGVGDRVKQGQIIGLTGSPTDPGNGYGTGPHIHWEVWSGIWSEGGFRVPLENLEQAGIAGPWDGGTEDTMFTVDGKIDGGRLDMAWSGGNADLLEKWPRVAEQGIPQRWEEEFRAGKNLGPVVSDEMPIPGGGGAVIRYFVNGWICWYPDGSTTVN
jgi:murein DD-endopeptidase MepM/ murein hydrolase activator NlpD